MKKVSKIIIAVSIFALLFNFLFFWAVPNADSYFYWGFGEYIKTRVFPYAYPFIYQRPPTVSPPMYALILLGLSYLPSQDIILRVIQTIMLVMSGLFVYKTLIILKVKKHIAYITLGLFFLMPVNIIYTNLILTEIPAQFFVSLFVYLFFLYMVKKKSVHIHAAIGLGFVMTLMKYSLLVYAGFAGLLLLFKKAFNKKYLVYPILGFVILLGWIYANNKITAVWGLSDNKKAHLFNENAWRQKKNSLIERETRALKTRVSIKFFNLLLVTTNKVTFELLLSNNSKIGSSMIVGLSDNFEINCPSCEQTFETGYATNDGFYLCENCVVQSIETGNIYSKNFQLARDNTTNEFMESDQGFVCAVCGKLTSNKFQYQCNEDSSLICYRCYELCQKCEKIFSIYNIEQCVETGKNYCPKHVVHCSNCGNPVGIDNYQLCKASAKKLCSCTNFQKCDLCEVEYSSDSLLDNKCPACNGLSFLDDDSVLVPVIEFNPSYKQKKSWLVGKNEKNLVLIAKGRFSDTLFVVENNKVVSSNKISLFQKMRGY